MIGITKAVQKIHRLKSRIKIIQGGTGAGKTIAIILILIDRAEASPDTTITILSDVYPRLRDGAMQDFFNIMRETGRWAAGRWNGSEHTYYFNNGSLIRFRYLDDPDKAKGMRQKILYINEANRLRWAAIPYLLSWSDEVYIDYNPDSIFWVHKELLGREDAKMIILTASDNEQCPSHVLEQIEYARTHRDKVYWDNWYRVYGLGEVGGLLGRCFPKFGIKDKPKESELLGYGLDFGYANDCTALVEISKYRDDLYIKDIIYSIGLSGREIRKRATAAKVNFIKKTIADNDPRLIDDLKFMEKPYWNITRADRTEIPGEGKSRKAHTIGVINQYNLFFTPESKDSLSEVESFVWDSNRDGEVLNEPKEGGDDDAMMGMIYGCGYFLRERFSHSLNKRLLR